MFANWYLVFKPLRDLQEQHLDVFYLCNFYLDFVFIICHIAASFSIGHKSMNAIFKSWLGLVKSLLRFATGLPWWGPCALMKFSIGPGLSTGIVPVSTEAIASKTS